MLILIIFCMFSYAIGSLSSAIIVCRLSGLPDPRTVGSKNPGATNVLRVGNKKTAILTLLGDVLKGVIPVLIIKHINPIPLYVGAVMVAVVLGHLYPVFFQFKGGKGVATAIGAILALCWPVGLLLLATWGIVFKLFKYSSLAALVMALCAPFYIYLILNLQFAMPVLIISGLLFWRHRANIQRLIAGTEPKVGVR